MLTVGLFVLYSLLSIVSSQFVPPRFDLAIKRLRQYQNFPSANLIKDVQYSITPEQMLERLSLSFSNNKTTPCEQDFELILRAASQSDMWAIKVLDAWGKPLPSGVLKGNVYWVGNYDECLQPMYFPANKSFIPQPFDTQHCKLFYL
jgi:hypothetical protein